MSIKGLSSGALFAKVKACSTELLTDADYLKAASCTSLPELASFLKNKTPYSDAFEGIGSSVRMTRLHLESVIKRMTLLRMAKIIRYASLTDNYVSDYFMMKHETECIISRLRQHGEYTIDSYLMYMPDGFFTETSFDLKALEHATDTAGILKAIERTHYREILAPVLEKHEPGQWIPENLLYRNLYETGAANFQKKLNSEDYQDVEELLAMLSDMITVNNIYRIKKYYPDSEEAMLISIFSSALTRFSHSQLSGLKSATTATDFTDRLALTKYKELAALFNTPIGALFTKQYIYNICKKHFIRTNNAALSALCYSRLISNEADNLISITEGISAKTEPERICAMLIK